MSKKDTVFFVIKKNKIESIANIKKMGYSVNRKYKCNEVNDINYECAKIIKMDNLRRKAV